MLEIKKLEHTADLAYEIKGDSLEELFKASFLCWKNALLNKEPTGVKRNEEFNFSEVGLESLMVEFLNHFNFLFFVRGELVREIKIIKIKKNQKYVLTVNAEITGLEEPEVFVNQEIKAVTYHQLSIKKEGGVFSTRIVFDV